MPENNPIQTIEALAEAEFQHELSSLFVLDSQAYLQRYDQIVRQLHAQSWETDVQELYRCIHTVKGGAVTVAAEAILQAATRLEDLLSDLRYLTPAPPLNDGALGQMLLEAGELLTGTLELFGEDVTAIQIDPTLSRIEALHSQVQTQYLSSWNEQKHLHQEFAEQGFDLVVLELEIALERSPTEGDISLELLNMAQQTLIHLRQIGEALQLASGWTDLLTHAETLFDHPTNAIWRSQWLRFFQALKTCIKQSGVSSAFEFEGIASEPDIQERSHSYFQEPEPSASILSIEADEGLTGAGDWLYDMTHPQPSVNLEESKPDAFQPDAFNVQGFLDAFEQIQQLTGHEAPPFDHPTIGEETVNFADPTIPLFEPNPDSTMQTPLQESASASFQPTSFQSAATADPPQSQGDAITASPDKIQIPVSLEKLDQSAQHLIGTLLSARMIRGLHHTLQNQITQMAILAQEGARYITNLRQLQDDYAVLDGLRPDTQGPTPERYRQGYTTINRLLETSLKLTELGAETEKTAQQTIESLQNLDGNLIKLQNTVEDSRLVPFQNLSFRAKAILRDLTNRFGKPAQLIIKGETIELDVGTIRSLEPVLLHLIRNAYGHGLEAPSARNAQGKPEQGTITVSLQRRGNAFHLCVEDDGCGMDAEKIQKRAEALNLSLKDAQTLSKLLAVICQPGFSVETQVNEISGRGVGMDVVATQVARLGGKLSLKTTLGHGTAFYVQFPVPHLLVSCMVLQAGNQAFAVPVEYIKRMTLFETLDTQPAEGAIGSYVWTVQQNSETELAADLLRMWRPRSNPRSLPESAISVYVSAPDSARGIWLVVDELLGQSDVLINPLPSPLNMPDGLMGVSLHVDGRLIPVLEANVIAAQLIKAFAEKTEFIPGDPTLDNLVADDDTQTILIVDDAALIRRRIEVSLNAYGHSTHTCADGLEAWDWIQKHPQSTLIITDIEMPNMDGFTLINRCRQAGIVTPILVISSRLSEDWSSEARRMGATDYLNKGFSTVELMNKVTALINSTN